MSLQDKTTHTSSSTIIQRPCLEAVFFFYSFFIILKDAWRKRMRNNFICDETESLWTGGFLIEVPRNFSSTLVLAKTKIESTENRFREVTEEETTRWLEEVLKKNRTISLEQVHVMPSWRNCESGKASAPQCSAGTKTLRQWDSFKWLLEHIIRLLNISCHCL